MIILASCRGGGEEEWGGGSVGLLMLIHIQGDSQEPTWAVLIFMSSPCGCVCLVVCVRSHARRASAKS